MDLKSIFCRNLFKFKYNKSILQPRQPKQIAIFTRRFSSCKKFNGKLNNNKSIINFFECNSIAPHRIVVCTALGLAGFIFWKNKSIFNEVKCHGENTDSDKINNDTKNTDFFFPDCCYKEAIKQARVILEKVKRESSCPAITITVTVDGREVWSEGLGLTDVENNVPCTSKSVFRIASISKPMTMAAVAKLVEDKVLDLDLPIRHYVPEWPEKSFDGKSVEITTRQLVSMLSGVRHYDKDCRYKRNENKKKKRKEEFEHEEYFLNKSFRSVIDSLDIFKNDQLCSLPGTSYLYSTYNWTLVSAVAEKAANKKFENILMDMFEEMGLENTYLDENSTIIPNRARYYSINKKSKLQNAKSVNNSYKWAGGGLQSTPSDICKFGNVMLACYQGLDYKQGQGSGGGSLTTDLKDKLKRKVGSTNLFLSQETMTMIWTPVAKTKCNWDKNGFYGMGWCSVPAQPIMSHAPQEGMDSYTWLDHLKRQYFSHTGGAVGASSVLLVMPRGKGPTRSRNTKENVGKAGNVVTADIQKRLVAPQGTVVSIVTNMQSVGLNNLALEIAAIFETARDHHFKNGHNLFTYFMDDSSCIDIELMLPLFLNDE